MVIDSSLCILYSIMNFVNESNTVVNVNIFDEYKYTESKGESEKESEKESESDIIHPEKSIITLSREQEIAFDKFKRGENLFITGPGGTGKTALISQLVSWSKMHGKKLQVCALTGCAAVLLNCNARTLHSWSGIKTARGERDKIIHSVVNNRKLSKEWRKTQILIVDEVSMMSRKIFDIIDQIARIIRCCDRPFGGMQVIFTGDFYQLPPVGTAGEPDTNEFCFQSENWYKTFSLENHIELRTIFRQTDPLYIRILDQIRRGELEEANIQILQSYVKREYAEKNFSPMKLFPVRSKVEYVNTAMFNKLTEDQVLFPINIRNSCKTYLDTGKEIDAETRQMCAKLTKLQVDAEIEKMIANYGCPHSLALKKGAVVMCTVNLDMDLGICNGSQGIITDIRNGVPYVNFGNGVNKPIEMHFWQSEDYPTIAIGQIPLCLSWAMTIHKIQGASLKMAEIDIGFTIFEYGQTYVALSRIRSLEGLYLSAFNPHRIKANPLVKEFYGKIQNYIHDKTTDKTTDKNTSTIEIQKCKPVDTNIRIIRL